MPRACCLAVVGTRASGWDEVDCRYFEIKVFWIWKGHWQGIQQFKVCAVSGDRTTNLSPSCTAEGIVCVVCRSQPCEPTPWNPWFAQQCVQLCRLAEDDGEGSPLKSEVSYYYLQQPAHFLGWFSGPLSSTALAMGAMLQSSLLVASFNPWWTSSIFCRDLWV